MRSKLRHCSVVAAAILLTLGLAACTGDTEEPTPSVSNPVIAPTEVPDVVPEFVADGSAEDNRPFFDFVIARHIADGGSMDRQSIITVLVNSGWTVDLIEATTDQTPLGNATDAVNYSVRMGDSCIIGQWDGAPKSMVSRVLASGTCLIGTPHPVS